MISLEVDKVFNLDNESDYRKAERFKSKLERKGFKVTVENYPYRINAIQISGVL